MQDTGTDEEKAARKYKSFSCWTCENSGRACAVGVIGQGQAAWVITPSARQTLALVRHRHIASES